MTDNKIIKALDICGHLEACADCPLGDLGGIDKCMHTLLLNALDLINRQKAEIEQLRNQTPDCRQTTENQAKAKEIINVAQIKSESIKEFAGRLKKSAFDCDVSFGYGREHYTEAVAVIEIDNLVKEMVGDGK